MRCEDRHAGVLTLATMRSLCLTIKVPFALLNRLSKRADFPPPYRAAGANLANLTTNKYLYCREDVVAFLNEHYDELPDGHKVKLYNRFER